MTEKEEFINLLLSTNRRGILKVLSELEKKDFFHTSLISHDSLNHEGGLLKHSLNVYYVAKKIFDCLKDQSDQFLELNHSLVIISLLHDICQMGVEGDKGIVKMPIGHGEKSVILLLLWGLEMTEQEMLAIRWHMGAWDLSRRYSSQQDYLYACKNYPLVSILQAADTLATFITESTPIGNKPIDRK